MASVRDELVRYGNKIYQAHLVIAAGGNISARDEDLIWMKPSGMAMDEISPEDLCGINLETGEQVEGPHRPTSEVNMHLVAEAAREHDTIFMANHGLCALGVNMKQAYYRALIVEDAAKSLVAAATVGEPQFLTPEQEAELMAQSGPQHRVKMMESQ